MSLVRQVIIFLVIATSVTNNYSANENYISESTEILPVTAVHGIIAKLPCDITPAFPGDKLHIVIWFKEDEDQKLVPIYTFDSRNNIQLEQGKHWSDQLALGSRAHFRFQNEPATLNIDNVQSKDAGMYQCRVDFKQSPTRNTKLNLMVIIPPKKLNILDEKGIQIANYVLGPYNEGASINLTCIAIGGIPTPKVTWWLENALLDDSCNNLPDNTVRNILHMENLQRKQLHTVLTCQASNNDLVTPISTSLKLDLNLRPLSIKLLGENKPLSVGKLYQLSCEVAGCRPSPKISWWKGNTYLTNTQEYNNNDGNVTTSILHFTPSVEDDGVYLSCNAKHPTITDSSISSGRKLTVQYVPLVTLQLGSKLNNTLKEGSDVYFDCIIKSNPWVYKISWKHNGKLLFSNVTGGVIINNQSLVLQKISKYKSGDYVCVASNQLGDAESNSVSLTVKFAPTCVTSIPIVYEVSLQEEIRIRCELDTNANIIEFIWIFNDTEGVHRQMQFNPKKDTISYKPKTKEDYGTLFCKGVNDIGIQQQPCTFHIVPVDDPDLLSNCNLIIQINSTLSISCASSNDVFNHVYVAEVYNFQTHKLLKNFTSAKPLFTIEGLDPGLQVEINLYTTSQRGGRRTTRLNALIPSWEKLAVSPPLKFYITPTLAVTIGAVITVVLISLSLLAVSHLRKFKKSSKKSYGEEERPSSNLNCTADINTGDDYDEDNNPDIIPLNTKNQSNKEEPITDSSKTYISLQDYDESTRTVMLNPQFLHNKEHVKYPYKVPLPVQSEYEIDQPLIRGPKFCHHEHNDFSIPQPKNTAYIPEASWRTERNCNVHPSPLRNHFKKFPLSVLPQEQLIATQL